MLKIKTLTFQNIGRFTELQRIDFSTLGPLVQVDGKNANTGGSSGSGKTTVFNALDYLLGLNDIPNSLLQSRLTKSSIMVAAMFDYNDQDLTIMRSKAGLRISLNDELVGGSAKLSEEKLDQILGMPRDLFRSMLHKRQKEGGFFLALTPKETYDFLVDSLNLTELREKAAIVQAAATELAQQMATKHTALAAAQASLAATNDALLALGERPAVMVDPESFAALKADAEKAIFLLTNLKEGQEKELVELEKARPVAEVGRYDESRLDELAEKRKNAQEALNDATIAEIERQNVCREKIHQKKAEVVRAEQVKRSQLDLLNRRVIEGETAKTRAQRIANEIKQLRNQTCFTCGQNWQTESAKLKEQELLAELNRHKESIHAANEAEHSVAALLAELADDRDRAHREMAALTASVIRDHPDDQLAAAEREIAAIEAETKSELAKKHLFLEGLQARNRRVAEDFASEVNKTKARHSTMIKALAEEASTKRRALDLAVGSLHAQQESLARYEATFKQLMGQQEAAMEKLQAAKDSLMAITKKSMMTEEAKRAIRGYTSRLFDTALQTISETATQIIRQIPNMANATIQLSATRETGDGKIKEEVNAVIHNEGEENIPLKTLSGGERTSADLAVDLAAIQFLEDQAGKGIDLFILDEPFTGLDSANIEAIVEMLKVSSISKRIVVVDHNPVIAESFESKIMVKRLGASSVISTGETR